MFYFNLLFILLLLFMTVFAMPQFQKTRRPIHVFKSKLTGGLTLPHNATSIRSSIVDSFSCENKIYGFYADMENDCQIFHVCVPQKKSTIRWSFICPVETVFNQATFVCTRTKNSIPCVDSVNYYYLNQELGKDEDLSFDPVDNSLATQNQRFKN